ncbi:uncharacterized protein V6R79_017162 [Siganus canaliculatus]
MEAVRGNKSEFRSRTRANTRWRYSSPDSWCVCRDLYKDGRRAVSSCASKIKITTKTKKKKKKKKKKKPERPEHEVIFTTSD